MRQPIARTKVVPPLVMQLLAFAAMDCAPRNGAPLIPPQGEVDERQIRWVIDAGLGPLLYRAIRARGEPVPVAWSDTLLSADMTAQVWEGNRIDTTAEIIDVCRRMHVPVTLLKGISISDQHYPRAHLRPMGDVDLLVPASAYREVEAALLRRGFTPMPDFDMGDVTKHGIPLAHPRWQVWVELHTALFDGVRPGGTFGSSHVAAQSVPSTFHGRRVYRLSEGLQLLYIASSWMRDLSHANGFHPSRVAPLFDAVHLLNAARGTLDCDAFLGWPDGEMPTASLYVMLAYLQRHGLVACAPAALARLGSSQHIVGALQLRIIHATLDRYLVGGRRWEHALPLPVAGRYKLGHQVRKCLTRLTGGRVPWSRGV